MGSLCETVGTADPTSSVEVMVAIEETQPSEWLGVREL